MGASDMSARHPKTTYLRGRAPAHWWYKPDSMNIGQVADPGTTAMARERAGEQWQEARPGRVDGGYKNLFWIQNDCFGTQLRYLLTL